jgi:hypothetical protein
MHRSAIEKCDPTYYLTHGFRDDEDRIGSPLFNEGQIFQTEFEKDKSYYVKCAAERLYASIQWDTFHVCVPCK